MPWTAGRKNGEEQEAGTNHRQQMAALYKTVDSSLAGFDYIEQILNDE